MAQARARSRAQRDVLRHLGDWAGRASRPRCATPTRTSSARERDIEGGHGASRRRSSGWSRRARTTVSASSTFARSPTPCPSYATLRTALMKARFDHNVAMAALSKATGTLEDGSNSSTWRRPSPRTRDGAKRGRREAHRVVGAGPARRWRSRSRAGAALTAGEAGARGRSFRKTVDDAFAVLRGQVAGRRGEAHASASRRCARSPTRPSTGPRWRAAAWARMARPGPEKRDALRGGVQGRAGGQYMDDIDRFQGTEIVTVDGSAREGEDVVVHRR